MQIKKADIRQNILECAKDEFCIQGYENASMRQIAKKANTSLGNIYHYFQNKKAVLNAVLEPEATTICKMIEMHACYEQSALTMQEINEYIEEMDFESLAIKTLFSKEFVIFMETKDKEYSQKREVALDLFRQHIALHMRINNPKHHFVLIIVKMIVDSVIHMVKCDECIKQRRKDVITIFKILCRSVADQNTIEAVDIIK